MLNFIKDIFSKRISKAMVDILLLVGLVLSIITGHHQEKSWLSLHCIVSMTWYGLMLVHIWQHWRMTTALLRLNKKTLRRNLITLLTAILFILMTFSVISFIVVVNDNMVFIHHRIAHIFWAVIILHTIMKAKQFLACFR